MITKYYLLNDDGDSQINLKADNWTSAVMEAIEQLKLDNNNQINIKDECWTDKLFDAIEQFGWTLYSK